MTEPTDEKVMLTDALCLLERFPCTEAQQAGMAAALALVKGLIEQHAARTRTTQCAECGGLDVFDGDQCPWCDNHNWYSNLDKRRHANTDVDLHACTLIRDLTGCEGPEAVQVWSALQPLVGHLIRETHADTAETVEWGVRFPSGAVQVMPEGDARRYSLNANGLRPDLPTLVVRKVVRPWEVASKARTPDGDARHRRFTHTEPLLVHPDQKPRHRGAKSDPDDRQALIDLLMDHPGFASGTYQPITSNPAEAAEYADRIVAKGWTRSAANAQQPPVKTVLDALVDEHVMATGQDANDVRLRVLAALNAAPTTRMEN